MAGGEGGQWMVRALGRAITALVLSRFVSQNLTGLLARTRKEDLTVITNSWKPER
jgi:hypothetical protein